MPLTYKRIGVVGSREFKNYNQLTRILDELVRPEDQIVSGGASGADSMAQRWAKETGHRITIHYPNWRVGRGAGFLRNKDIVVDSDRILAFYAKGHFQEGGTANTADWARKLNKELHEYEEE